MLCDFCHENDAVFFIEKLTPQGKLKIAMCPRCAQKRGITPNSENLGKNIEPLFAEIEKLSGKFKDEESKVCPVCGTSLGSIKKTRKAGCSDCYEIFKNEIDSLMVSRGIKGTYTGSMPLRLAKFRSSLTDRNLIQMKLDEAIKKEDYEKAAFYRDYLRAMEKAPVATISMTPDSSENSENQSGGENG